MRGEIEGVAAVGRIVPNQSPAHRRQRGALLGGHQLRVDLVAGIGIAVDDDEVAQLFFLCWAGGPRRAESR